MTTGQKNDQKNEMIARIDESKQILMARCPQFPKIVIVLGSGLSEVLKDMTIEAEIPYSEIPHVKSATVEGHRGRLLIGDLHGVRVACMQGRLHFYEGHKMEDVVFPFRLFAVAGAEAFVLTNASGGLHTDMAPLDLCLIRDHINLMGTNPLIGPNLEQFGTRFPDMTHLYDPDFCRIFATAADRLNISLRQGVYVAIHGPSYETPAEIRMYRILGGDIVGMSTVPEAIALHHMGKRVVAVSCITNLAAGVTSEPLVHSEVLENAKKAYGQFSRLLIEAVKQIGKELGGESRKG